MASHKMAFKEETADQVVFECAVCARSMGLHKPETGRSPAAVKSGDEWNLPINGEAITAMTLGERCDG